MGMSSLEINMKKILLSLLLASLGLAGCIAVPYDRGYGYGPRHGHYGGGRGDHDRRDYDRRDYR
jgi:hypothetical protein